MSFIPLSEAPSPRPAAAPARRVALFDYGFRPFFLLSGLQAVLALAVWLAILLYGLPVAGSWDTVQWHMHEMLFGFVAAAVGGFLLTAVPNWTGGRGYAGRPLVLLTSVWLLGRVAVNPIFPFPPLLAAAADLAFFPALAATLLPSLVRSGNRRNYPFPAMLGGLFLANLLCHLDGNLAEAGTWRAGILLAVDMVLLMVVMIGGRIVPSFTSSAMKRVGRPVEIAPRPWLERAALATLLAMAVADQATPDGALAGITAAAAAAVTLARLAGWHGWRTLSQPILAILHVGYAWVPVGLALKAAWLLAGAGFAAHWMHAFTLGAFATMILAVMSRASLGHTGRDVVASWPTAAAYVLLTAAALARVFLAGFGAAYHPALMIAGLGWIGAFGLFVLVYAPILVRPRADGRPG